MKNLFKSIILLIFVSTMQTTEAQFVKKLKKKAENAAENAIINKTEKKVYNETSKQMDTLLGSKKKKETKKSENKNISNTSTKKTNQNENQEVEIWRNYKFIPGEKVIFYDDLKSEEIGEFPSRWDLVKGGAEVVRFNGEKVIIGTADHNRIIPLFDKTGYLSDEFTIEFDIYVDDLTEKNYMCWADYSINFDSKKIKYRSSKSVQFRINRSKIGGYASSNSFKLEKISAGQVNQWHHVSISYYKGKFKMYYDDKRVSNIPKFNIQPDIFSIDFYSNGHGDVTINQAIKNIRIAHGGGQMYKRIMADGKYVTNGILFDSGKSMIKPQSMGIINKIATVMEENPDWKFQIIGHTDSDGSTEDNLTLSKERADAVKQALIKLNIDENRIDTTGKGEDEPLSGNKTPEEKANNRRVEFLLKK